MPFYDMAYLLIFVLLPLSMFFLPLAHRFLILWILIFLLPREFNLRLGPFSFCLTDAAFAGFVLPEIVTFFREGWKKSRLAHGSEFVWVFLGLFIFGTLFHLTVGGFSNPRFFLKDILVFGTFPVLLLALRRSGLEWKPVYLWTMASGLAALIFLVLLIESVPGWKENYILCMIRQNQTGIDLGYFLPSQTYANYSEAQIARIASQVRYSNFIGGVPYGIVFLFCFPMLFGLQFLKRWKAFLSFLLVGFLCYGSFFMVSRTVFAAILLGTFACLILFPKEPRRMASIGLGIFLVLALATPIGQSNWNRFSLLKNKELEGIYKKIPKGQVKSERGIAVYDSRIPIWKAAFSKIKEHPLVGIGPGRTLVFPYGKRTGESAFVDSLYITIALKWGLGAFVLFWAGLAALGRTWWKAWPSLQKRLDFEGAVLRGFVPAVIAFLFVGIFAFPLMNVSFSMFLACFLGLSLNTMDAHLHKKKGRS